MQALARRLARARAIQPEKFMHWAMLTVLTTFDDETFECLFQASLDLTHLSANELLNAIIVTPLHVRAKRRAGLLEASRLENASIAVPSAATSETSQPSSEACGASTATERVCGTEPEDE